MDIDYYEVIEELQAAAPARAATIVRSVAAALMMTTEEVDMDGLTEFLESLAEWIEAHYDDT